MADRPSQRPPPPGLPSIDVIVPAYNEEEHIDRCLDYVLGQDYPADRYRVLVVDAGSEDATAALAGARAESGQVKVISGGRLSTPEALNRGIDESNAEIVARVDAHGYPEPDFLRRGVEALQDGGEDVACVGGRPLEASGSRFAHAFTLARGSRFGVGGSVYAAGSRGEVDTVPWGMYRRSALVNAGGFDPAMNHGEDEELNWRLRRAGYRVIFDPAIRFRYVPRSTLAGVYRQYRSYGEARVRVVAAHPDFLRPRHLAPAGLVLAAGGLLAAAGFSRLARRALAGGVTGYAAAAAAASLSLTRGEDVSLAPLVAACFPALHFGYGIGTLRGVLGRSRHLRRSGRLFSVLSGGS